VAKTTTTIGTVTVTANYEATPEGFHPDGSLHIASDGRAIVVYAYWLYNSWRFAFRSSDPAKTTWTDETVILNPDNQHSGNNINRIASCMDASGHVYVAMLYYENKGYGRSFIKYCKLTKAGAGWSAGSVSAVCEDWNSLAPKWQTLHVAHDGEWPFIGQNGYVSQNGAAAYAVLYPQSPPYWTSCYGNGNMNDATCMSPWGWAAGAGTGCSPGSKTTWRTGSVVASDTGRTATGTRAGPTPVRRRRSGRGRPWSPRRELGVLRDQHSVPRPPAGGLRGDRPAHRWERAPQEVQDRDRVDR